MAIDAPRFFVDPPLAAGAFTLPQPVAHHARNVLRLRSGDALRLFDGTGGEWHGRLHDGPVVQLERFDPVDREPPRRLVLLQSLVATDKLDWIVEKAVELGVADLHLAPAARSSVKLPADRLARRLAHWRQVIVAACAQCGRNRVPSLHWHGELRTAWAVPTSARALLAPDGDGTLADWLSDVRATGAQAPEALAVAVGPEGGWSDDERLAATASGWQPVTLGPRVLRTETAGLAALAVLGARCGDL